MTAVGASAVESQARAALAATTRDRLLESATAVFSERGYDGAGVQEIARRAGLTTGAIYANFRGKAELLFAAIGTRSAAELDELLRSQPTNTAGELLAELGSHLLDTSPGARGALLVEAIVAARRDADLAGLIGEVVGSRRDVIGHLVEIARDEGAVSPTVSTDALATFALVLLLGSLLFKSLELAHPADEEWSALIHRFVNALKEDVAE